MLGRSSSPYEQQFSTDAHTLCKHGAQRNQKRFKTNFANQKTTFIAVSSKLNEFDKMAWENTTIGKGT